MTRSTLYKTLVPHAIEFYGRKDRLWLVIWLASIGLLWIWDRIFLNYPAFVQVETAFLNTCLISLICIVFSVILSWSAAVGIHFLPRSRAGYLALPLTFLLNLIRSIPQIIGVLGGYILITVLLRNEIIESRLLTILLMAFCTSVFVFQEIVDLIRERIDHYTKLDFVNAMLCCGIKESRIINIEILWRNSLIHIMNKLIAIFGIAIFLQCSVDFIISVGLSTGVSSANLPLTLGSLLAKIDSKQDILAIGYTLANPGYVGNLFFQHLQGITIAFLIVFTLLSIYRISNGYAKRHHL